MTQPILRVAQQLPVTHRDWEQFLRKLNTAIRDDGQRAVLGALTTISERTGTDLATLASYLTDQGRAEDQRMLPQVSAGNVLSTQDLSPLTAIADATTAEITIAAHTNQYGFGQVAYNGGTISGLLPETTYYVYANDPDYEGGAVTYVASTNRQNVTAANGRYLAGAITTSVAATAVTITAATSANPVEFTTSANHGWNTGDDATFASLPGDFGTALNGQTKEITRTAADKFTVVVNGSGFAAYTSGGTATRVSPTEGGSGGGGGGWLGGFAIP